MPSLFFVLGSAAGAVIAWYVARGELSRGAVAAITGVVCCMLGITTSASHGTTGLVTEAGLGLLGAAAPLTLCTNRLNRSLDQSQVFAAVRRLVLTLAVALVYGISCATVGFVSSESVRLFFSASGTGEEPVDHPIPAPWSPAGAFGPAVTGCL